MTIPAKSLIYKKLKIELNKFNFDDIENAVMIHVLSSLNRPIERYKTEEALLVTEILRKYNLSSDIREIIQLFESLLDLEVKTENGIVFTPKFISDYILESVIEANPWDESKKFIDPSCGGGIFLVSTAELLHTRYGLDIDLIIEKYIFGMDIIEQNVKYSILALRLLSAKYGGNYNNIICNIRHCDSLRNDWSKEFKVDKFSYIIGNPPYINPHDLNNEVLGFLRSTFITTTTGVFNIFYAFIEHAMENLAKEGVIGYIVPNNFLTIKSAFNIRKLIQTKQALYKIVDFGSNMIFRPIRTYSCIILLTKEIQRSFKYSLITESKIIESSINNIVFNILDIDKLNAEGWRLFDEHTRVNIDKIENQMIQIKPFIKTGIATLRDEIYMVEKDNKGYFKYIESKKIYVEDSLIKQIYKISELRSHDSINADERYIIFPYEKSQKAYKLISENNLINNFPQAYKVLLAFKSELDKRDKGKPNRQAWYAYGRTQGLNKFGRMILSPTFAKKPKFILINKEDALFCNGYGIFENEQYELEVLIKILNSKVMNYYINNISYSIEGGYYCYQKKYIERFSVPLLSELEIKKIHNLSGDDLDNYLWSLYDLD